MDYWSKNYYINITHEMQYDKLETNVYANTKVFLVPRYRLKVDSKEPGKVERDNNLLLLRKLKVPPYSTIKQRLLEASRVRF